MKNLRKLLISTGTISMAVLPVVAVVSCGDDGQGSTQNDPITQDGITITHKGNQILTISVDGTKFNSADEILAKLANVASENGLLPVANPADVITVTGNDTLKAEVESHRTPSTTSGTQSGTQSETQSGTQSGTQTQVTDVNTIDITNKSVEETIDALVRLLHVNMDIIDANENAWTMSNDMRKVVNYMNQVDVNKVVTLRNGTQTYSMDFRPVQQWVDKVAEAAAITDNPNLRMGKPAQIGAALGNYGMPEIAFFTGYSMGVLASTEMAEFMGLSTTRFGSVSNEEFFDNHGYIQMLKEYHKIIWKFVQSDFYKNWIGEKQFRLIEEGTHTIEIVNNGEKFDDTSITFNGPGGEPRHGDDSHFESSNFEVEFGLRLLNAYGKINQPFLPQP